MMEDPSTQKPVKASIRPGICGLPCRIEARKKGKYTVLLGIEGSECKHIKRLSGLISELTVKGLFAPLTRNPVFLSAQSAGCHASCPVPTAVLKVAEVAMEMALPKDVVITFEVEASGLDSGQKT